VRAFKRIQPPVAIAVVCVQALHNNRMKRFVQCYNSGRHLEVLFTLQA
jgi:hypothetical protein